MWKIVHFKELWKQPRDCVSGELSHRVVDFVGVLSVLSVG